jgi:hypothetical protein
MPPGGEIPDARAAGDGGFLGPAWLPVSLPDRKVLQAISESL